MVAPVIIGAGIGAAGGILGGILGNRASAGEAERNRDFQRYMYRHRYQFSVEDMRRAGLNPALAYQQGGGSAPSGSMASQEDVISPGMEAAGRGIASALAVKQNAAQVAQTQAQTRLITAQAKQLEAESPARAEWWRVRPMTETGRQEVMGAEIRQRQLAIDFMEMTFGDRAAIVGFQRAEMQQLLVQLRQEIELRGLERAPLEVQAEFAKSWYGKNIAPYVSSAGGISGIISTVIGPWLRFLNSRSGPQNVPPKGGMKPGFNRRGGVW